MIFVNLPTSDLERAKSFYTSLGFTINPLFTDENAACVVVDENVFFMILTRGFFSTFTSRDLVDPGTHIQVLNALSRDSREHVDSTTEAGLANGGKEHRDPQDLGFMYSRSLEDPDGNILEFVYMEPQAVENGPGEHVAAQAAE
ncbi:MULTISPECIES: VOC family protein [Arthrobacter]|uniref:VOC family protein n=2 Tax=Arthrobacter TaxID=1663 RepID=A0ABU9KJ60_9MICC|nr:VOC family protein [Arthrobacter sp. YJM1]MDP5226935.1 glyoxalase [Arthrobacter sp. YJM1]